MTDTPRPDEQRRRERLRRAMDEVDRTLPKPGAPPEWDTPGGSAKWIHDLRYEKSPRQLRIEAMQREDWPWPEPQPAGDED